MTEEFNIYYNPRTRLWQKEPAAVVRFTKPQIVLFALMFVGNILMWVLEGWFTGVFLVGVFIFSLFELIRTHRQCKEIDVKIEELKKQFEALAKHHEELRREQE